MRRRLVLTALAAMFVVVAACSPSSDEVSSGIPDVSVTDVATGDPVSLTSVAEPGLPTLVWFWAPH